MSTVTNDQNIPTFSMENKLQSLPLPSLKATLQKYLESVKVFLNQNEYENTERIVREFENGIGSELNFYLQEWAKNKRNWLEEWWLDWAYLEWRLPIAPLINTTGQYNTSNFIKNTNGQSVQIANTSLHIYYTLCFFEELRNETLPAEMSKNGYLSMEQHRRLFNTCRIPCKYRDRLDVHFKTITEGVCPTHIIIIYKHRFFLLNPYHPIENTLLNVSEIYDQLSIMVEEYSDKPNGIGIGALTADNRDTWAENREYLMEIDKTNEENLKLIEQSVFVVVLDDELTEDYDQIAQIGLIGNALNRFFDKSIQLIVSKTGHSSSNCDHTPFDGIISVKMSDYAQKRMIRENMNDSSKVNSYKIRSNIDKIKELQFVVDSKIKNSIHRALDIYKKNVSLVSIKVNRIDFCTKDTIKSYKLHPDTFAQMAIQLAYYQMHKKLAPTYETASTRGYYHGRTETMRTCTQEVVNWIKAMDENRLSKSELLDLFKIAYTNHDKLITEASNNQGCDRHLLGLRLTARSMNIELPEIYKDVAWKKSGGDGNFVISSSCIGFTDVFGGCYPMCEDGYGVFYRLGDDGMTFFVATFTASKETNPTNMQISLSNAVRSIQSFYESSSKI